MTSLEYEELKERIESLEQEVFELKAAMAVGKAPASVINTNIVTPKEMITKVPEGPEIFCVPASFKKLLYTDNLGIKHKYGLINFEADHVSYVAVTENDFDEEIWLSLKGSIDTEIKYTDVLHPTIELNGITVPLFAHVDNPSIKWKREFNVATGHYDFLQVGTSQADNSGTEGSSSGYNYAPGAASNKKKEPVSFERALGTKWMGIFASILIFIAFISFGASIYSFLGETAKAVILLAISGAFTYVGLRKLEKNPEKNVLWNIVSGCGIGGCYITFLLMNLVFNIINDIVLCILLVLWILATIYMAKRFSNIFYYVCYLGILISTVLCEKNWASSMASPLFYLVATCVLILARNYKEYRRNYFWSIQFPIVFIYFTIVYFSAPVKCVILFILLLAIVLMQPHVFEFETYGDGGVYIIAHVLPALMCLTGLIFAADSAIGPLAVTYSIAFMLLSTLINAYYKLGSDNPFIGILFYINVVFLPLLPYGYIYHTYLGYAAFLIPALVYGIVKDRTKYIAIAAGYLAAYFFLEFNDVEFAIRAVVTLIVFIALTVLCFKRYIKWLRYYLVFFSMASIWYIAAAKDFMNEGFVFIAVSVLCLCINNKHFTHEEFDLLLLSKILTILTSLAGYALIVSYDEDMRFAGYTFVGTSQPYIILISLIALAISALCYRYSYWLEITDNRNAAGIATGTGYLIMILSITDRLSASGLIVSLLLIVLAIVFITSGFISDIKAIRLYGLLLSLICIIKLVFFDISYDSSIYYPLGLFVCGALCLLICWIYNKIEKSHVNDEVE